MRRLGAGLVRAGVVSGAFGLVLAGLPAVYFLTAYGCGGDEDRIAEVMAGEAVLDSAPQGAEEDERYRSCDEDDLFVVVGARYRYDGPAESFLRHYREAAPADGWRPRTTAGSGDGAAPGCFSKSVAGTTAYLIIVDGDAGVRDDGHLYVEIVADHEGSSHC